MVPTARNRNVALVLGLAATGIIPALVWCIQYRMSLRTVVLLCAVQVVLGITAGIFAIVHATKKRPGAGEIVMAVGFMFVGFVGAATLFLLKFTTLFGHLIGSMIHAALLRARGRLWRAFA
jgi:hypothetical protein